MRRICRGSDPRESASSAFNPGSSSGGDDARFRHRRLRHDRPLSMPGPWPRCPVPGWWRWSAAAPPAARKMADELGLRCDIYEDLKTCPRPWPAATWTWSSSPRRRGATWSRPSPRRRPASTSSSRSRWKSPWSAATASSTRATATASSSAPSSVALADANGAQGRRRGRPLRPAARLGETTCKWWRPQSYYDEGGWKGTRPSTAAAR